jgi:hypothetical protein
MTDASRALVAHACNLRYSRGRDQEDPSLKPTPGQIVRETLSQKYSTQKRAGRAAQEVACFGLTSTKFKPQYYQKKKKDATHET